MLNRLLLAAMLLVPATGCYNYAQIARDREITEAVENAGGEVLTVQEGSELSDKLYIGAIVDIFLYQCYISTDLLKNILPLETLQQIDLTGTYFHDHEIDYLIECPNLRTAHLSFTNITDNAVAQFPRFKKLSRLNLEGCEVTDKCIDDLLAMNTLEQLILWDTQVTEKGIEKLKANMPSLKIHWYQTKSEEARRARCRLVQRGHSTFCRGARPVDTDPLTYSCLLKNAWQEPFDPQTAEDLNTLSKLGQLHVEMKDGLAIPMLRQVNRIDKLELNYHSNSFQHARTEKFDEIDSLTALNVEVNLSEIPVHIYENIVQIKDLESLGLHGEEITLPIWQVLIAAPSLNKISFEDCTFPDLEQFPPAERMIQVELDLNSLSVTPEQEKQIQRLLGNKPNESEDVEKPIFLDRPSEPSQ